MDTEPTVVSLFSGCGGLDLGLEQAGCEIAIASDVWDEAVNTYEHNFGSTVLNEDVNDVSNQDLQEALEDDGYSTDDIDIVAGGPPCQGFSRLNNNKIELDEMEKDDRNTLFQEFIRLGVSVEPEVIIIENVRDLINREASDGSYIKDHIVAEIESHGYDCEYQVLKAEEHGVPQERRRIFFVATNGDTPPSEIFPDPTTKDNPVTAGEALDGIDDSLPNMRYTNSQDSTIEKIKHVPQGGYHKHIPDRLKKKDENGDPVKRYGTYLRRLDPDEPSLTINTNPFIHTTEDRYLTPREMARLQSFPDDFEFLGNKGDVIQQIANAVPPKLGEEFGKQLVEVLDTDDGKFTFTQ
jgi:DNA (cytosine-5)-methyltransferase 1